MKKFALYTAGAVLMLAAAACDRDLDLAHAYDNSSSSKPYEFDKDFNFDDYIDFGSFVVSDRVVCEQQPDIPRYSFWLDGKISVGKYDDSGRFTLYWSADHSLRQTSDSPWLEENVNALSAEMEVFGKDLEPVDGFYDGGAWFIGVHKLPDGRLAGFFHAESHWAGSNSAYKSIGVTYSRDNGLTWEKGSRILAGTDPKPENPAGQGVSYGLGDGCVVWNEALGAWICYYSGYCNDPGNYMITMARSTDPAGAAGTWKKWDGEDFTIEGCNQQSQLGGENFKIANLDAYAGGNPSVMWNHYLNKWVMVFHSWSQRICLSTSSDGIVWEAPKSLDLGEEKAMYPNLISEEGDLTGGQAVRLYYAADMNDLGQRSLAWRKVVFY